MWYGGSQDALPRMRQQLALDAVWVVPGEIRKHYLQDELHCDRLEASVYLNWSAGAGLKNQVKIVLENGYACSAPASLLAAFSEIFRKLILIKISQEQFSSGKEIIVHLNGMPNLTNAGLYNVVAFIQNGQIKFLETELENILVAANDLRVAALVSLICEEMTVRILENTSSAVSMLYTAVACLPPQSQYRSMVVDGAAMKFRDIMISPELLKLSFEMLYSLISSPVLQGSEWVMQIYETILFWLRNNPEQICLAPPLLDSVNFKIIINAHDNRLEIIKKSWEVPNLGPIVQLFLMDAAYAQFLDGLMLPVNRDQSLSSSIYTISGAETATVPTPMRGPLGLAPSPLGSYIIAPFDSTSHITTRSISNETSVSLEKNWCPTQQLPIGCGSSHNPTGYQSSLANTATQTAQAKIASNVGDSGQRLWSEVLADRPKHTSKSGNLTGEMVSFQSTTALSTLPSKSSHDSIPTVITARSGPAFTYSSAATGGKQETSTAITSSPTLESVGIRTSSSQESASSSKRRRKFEQIPLRTEPPKSRKELRKERQARERAGKK
uniref:BACK domain-containing protein n=1 Tax=Loa loa TaxID=7209 RepID=A0A1I7VQJ8_LOALO